MLAALRRRARSCDLCPHACGVDRLADARGRCRTGRHAVVASAAPHFGEEGPISGFAGSGTIFFAHCNLYCVFCQNADISHGGDGEPLDARALAGLMLRLQQLGCHNINLVTPSHVILQVVEAVALAAADGLCVPIVYNSGGYDSTASIHMLHEVVDIYMPDLKFLDAEAATRWTIAPDYPERAREAVRAMQAGVGDLIIGPDGVAVRGLLVRHLVLPGMTADSCAVLRFLAESVSRRVYVNIMSQYHPCHEARAHSSLRHVLRAEEYQAVTEYARSVGLERVEFQCRRFREH
ncbi:MAG: radical SAM protein [Acidobacteria bacterium]|nr:radical SAM protein [Acidobacteriota bacterium]